MADTAAHLCDRVLPHVPYRQWTLSLPRRLRFLLARDGGLLAEVLRAFLRMVFAWQRRRARDRGVADGHTGAVTFVQRFGSLLNLNVHYHATVPDGVFALGDDGAPTFHPLTPPSDEEVEHLTRQIIRRTHKILARHEADAGEEEVADALACAQAVSVHAEPSPARPPPGWRPRLGAATARTKPTRCALIDGFSLHANVRIHEHDRLGLERLLRYGARPALAQDRLSLHDDGLVHYRFRRPATSGRVEWIGSPLDFLSRLATLIPPPRQNTVRYHGLFAPHCKLRSRIVPRAAVATTSDVTERSPSGPVQEPTATTIPPGPTASPATVLARRLDWAALLERVLGVDVTQCPRCHGRLRVLAFLSHVEVVRSILDHLGLPADAPAIAPARAPPQRHIADDFSGSW